MNNSNYQLNENGTQQNPNAQYIPPSQYDGKKRKKKKGCLGCLIWALAFFLVTALVIAGVFLWITNKPSTNIVFGNVTKLTSAAIPATGGTVTVSNPGSEINGMIITVPDKALDKPTNFKVSVTEIKNHKFGENFNPITPLISVENGHVFSNDPMTITVPISISEDEFAMGFYYDRKTGVLEGIPVIKLEINSITMLTSHFSDIVISTIKYGDLSDVSIDTGFAPGVDDWQFTNNGTAIAPGGQCAGQSITEMWYFYNRFKGAKEPRLYGRFDNNDYGKETLAFQEDDSWGYRFASIVQDKINWNSKALIKYQNFAGTNDAMTYYSFAYSMLLTKGPQFAGIYSVKDGQPNGGHAMVVYKIAGNIIYVADPNYPADTQRTIEFDMSTRALKPYSSAANAREIAEGNGILFQNIGYFGVTSIVNFNTVSKEYSNMINGIVGNGRFYDYDLFLLESIDPVSGVENWVKCPAYIKTDEEKTAEVSDSLRGKLRFKAVNQYRNQVVSVFDGTFVELERKLPTSGTDCVFEVDLIKGMNDKGFLSECYTEEGFLLNDFKRVSIEYDRLDLSGNWEGTYTVTEAGHLFDFLIDQIAQMLFGAGFTKDIEEAKQITREGMDSETIGKKIKLKASIELTVDYDNFLKYSVTMTSYQENETPNTMTGEGELKNGELIVKFWDGSTSSEMKMRGKVYGTDEITGDFVANAFFVVKNAFSGVWEIKRTE